ncbi:helix-turn-helix domain-containing protein [Embleya sp. AB8]|uniref:helix-turn-helix domain-containing protein n=1 Tax=Embleya sp. AB8 TaxID=3156304 RepID=UPI003C77D302
MPASSRAEPSRAEPSREESIREQSSREASRQAKPSRAEPDPTPASASASAADPVGRDTSSRMSRVGPRLRELRLAQGLTLVQVAGAAGVTKGFLSLAERGKASVSVPTLLRICDAVGTSIAALFDYPDQDVVRSGIGAPLEMGGIGIEEFLLTPADETHVQVMRTVLSPGGGSGGAYALEAETVFAYMVRGSLELTVDGTVRRLGAGDSTTFSARLEHGWTNPGEVEAEVLWSIAPALPRHVTKLRPSR